MRVRVCACVCEKEGDVVDLCEKVPVWIVGVQANCLCTRSLNAYILSARHVDEEYGHNEECSNSPQFPICASVAKLRHARFPSIFAHPSFLSCKKEPVSCSGHTLLAVKQCHRGWSPPCWGSGTSLVELRGVRLGSCCLFVIANDNMLSDGTIKCPDAMNSQ